MAFPPKISVPKRSVKLLSLVNGLVVFFCPFDGWIGTWGLNFLKSCFFGLFGILNICWFKSNISVPTNQNSKISYSLGYSSRGHLWILPSSHWDRRLPINIKQVYTLIYELFLACSSIFIQLRLQHSFSMKSFPNVLIHMNFHHLPTSSQMIDSTLNSVKWG